jgi:hypothetical protein
MLLIARGRALNLPTRFYLFTFVSGAATWVVVTMRILDQAGWKSVACFGFFLCLSGFASVSETVLLRARDDHLEISSLLKRVTIRREQCRIFSYRSGSFDSGGRYTVCVTDDEKRSEIGCWLWSGGAERAASRLKRALEIP